VVAAVLVVAALETIKLLEAQGQAGKAITAVRLLVQTAAAAAVAQARWAGMALVATQQTAAMEAQEQHRPLQAHP
jgi:hypothetical protein